MNQEFPEDVNVIRVGDPVRGGGLYNMVFPGAFARADVLLPLLGIAEDKIARFRDVWVEREEDGRLYFRVYTRLGGGNRPDYVDAIERLRAHPTYVRDADDLFDTTYASFWFNVQNDLVDHLGSVACEPIDVDARWRATLEALT